MWYDALEFPDLVKQCRPKMTHSKIEDAVHAHDFVQLKADGWFVVVKVVNHHAVVITRGAEIRHEFTTRIPDALLLAEWVYGTNWASVRVIGSKVSKATGDWTYRVRLQDGREFRVDAGDISGDDY